MFRKIGDALRRFMAGRYGTDKLNQWLLGLAIVLIVMGAAELVSYFWNKITYSLSGILGLVVLLIGIWIFLKPEYTA